MQDALAFLAVACALRLLSPGLIQTRELNIAAKI
jgi:hypothetical protein